MKHILFFILLFISAPVFGQTLYTTGVTFCAGVPVHNPGTTGAKWALDTTTWNLYVRSYGTTWTLIGNNWIQNISGCAAPAYTPTKFQSNVAINACTPAEMYIYDGSSWNLVGGSGGLTGTGLANRLAYWTASGAIGYESTLLVDTTNNRLKIGDQVAPSYALDISNASNEGLRVKSSATGSAGIILENTSAGGQQWILISAGSAAGAGSIGDMFYYNNSVPTYSSFSLNSAGETDFFTRKAANVRFYQGGTTTQLGYIRSTDALMAMPSVAAYNDNGFGLAQVAATNILAGLNFGVGSSIGWSTGSTWFSTKDVGFNRQAANTLNLTDGSTGLGKLRLDKIVGTGATSATYAVSVVNSNDSTILHARNDRRVGINTAYPQRDMHIQGEARISDLTTDTPTRLVGADADGDLNEAGSGLANRLAYWTGTGRVGYGANLHVDTANARIGIGVVPSYSLDILNTANIGIRISSNFASGTSFEVSNTSAGGKAWLFSVGGSSQPASLIGDFFFYNSSDALYSGIALNTSGETDFWFRRSADIRFYNTGTGSQIGKIRASDGLLGLPFVASYTDVAFGLAQTTATNIKQGLNIGPSGLVEWTSGSNWYDVKDVGFGRQAANTLNLTNGSTGLGKLRLDKIVGTGATSATYAVSVVNSNDSTILHTRNDRRVGINTATPDVSFDAGDNTDAIKIPAGTTAQEPAVNNTLRFNSDRESLDARENGVMFRLTSSKTPSIAAGAAAGTGPTIAVAGNDLSMKVTLTTGTTATTGALFTVTYASSMDAGVTNYPVFSCADVDCTGLNLYVSAESNTAFTISTQNAPTDGVQYIINIHIGQ